MQNKRCFFFFLTRPFPRNISRFQNLTMTFPLLKERDNKYKCSLHKLFYCRLFILFVLSRIKLVLHFVVNVISVAERKNNNNVGQFVQKCKNSMFVVFIILVKILICLTFCCQHGKVSQRKKRRHLNVYVKYEQNRWRRHCKIESLFHETKQFNFPEKNVSSQTRLSWVSSQ